MLSERIKQPKLSDAIVEHFQTLIVEGTLAPGERLPPERELAEQLDVSRPSLREALQKLETRGLIEIRQGGRTFVKDALGPTITDPLAQLIHAHPELGGDLVEFRKALEGVAAHLAAMRATEEDREILAARFQAMEEAHAHGDPAQEAEADTGFHLCIADAAHNVILLHVMRSLFNLMQQEPSTNRTTLYRRKSARDILLKQHRDLFQGIMDGDAEAAHESALVHLSFVQAALREMEQEQVRKAVARRRLERFKAEPARKK